MSNKKKHINKQTFEEKNLNDKKHDSIPYRINFINDLLKDKRLKPLIDFDDLDTETFIHPQNKLNDDSSNNNAFVGGSKDSKSTLDNNIKYLLGKQHFNFYDIFGEIGGKLRYIKSGTTGHTFQGSINSDHGVKHYGVKVVAYPKKARYGDIDDLSRPENAEIMMIRLLSYFVAKKQTPHIVLPIAVFNSDIKPFTTLLDENLIDNHPERYQEFVDRYKLGGYYDTVSILLSEWANRGDLLDFIRRNYKEFTTLDWKVIFFQVISVFAVIQSKFPRFRHNDAKANNVLIHNIEKRNTIFSYLVCNKKYYIPNIGYIIKLWDFDFACIPGMVDNDKVSADWTNEINIRPIQNRYYDIHYFFNTLIKKGFFPELMTDPGIDNEIKDFVNRIVPKKFQKGKFVSPKGRILINDEYITPEQILSSDPLFESFRSYKPKPYYTHVNSQTDTPTIKKKYVLSPN